jgi:hypothetical protein
MQNKLFHLSKKPYNKDEGDDVISHFYCQALKFKKFREYKGQREVVKVTLTSLLLYDAVFSLSQVKLYKCSQKISFILKKFN